MLSEFLGTYMLVLTVGLNVLGGSKAPVWSIAVSLMCMIFALGTCSGAHFNPAVTVAIAVSVRNKIASSDVGKYIGVQLAGGICAALAYTVMESGQVFPLEPGAGHKWISAYFLAMVFTFMVFTFMLPWRFLPMPYEYGGETLPRSRVPPAEAVHALSA